MTQHPGKVKRSGEERFVERLRQSAEQMLHENPERSSEGLVILRGLLECDELNPHPMSIKEGSLKLAPRILALVWILQKFVNGLYRNFGPGTTGFPKSEGESLMYQILQDLGRFICWFLNEGEISLDSLTSALERYRRLLQITKWYIYKGPGTDYVTL